MKINHNHNHNLTRDAAKVKVHSACAAICAAIWNIICNIATVLMIIMFAALVYELECGALSNASGRLESSNHAESY